MPLAKDEFYGDKPKRREAWLRTLPQEVRSATDLTEYLKDALTDNKISAAAEMLAVCIQNKVWEHIAVYDDDNPEIKTYHPMEWCRDVLKSEPGELMKVVASPLPRPEVGAAAAIELIRMVKEYEPESFKLLIDSKNPRNWRVLLKVQEAREGGVWIRANAELDKVIKPHGRGGWPPTDPKVAEQVHLRISQGIFQKDIAKELGISQAQVNRISKKDLDTIRIRSEDHSTTERSLGVKSNAKGTNTRDSVRRRLERYAADQVLCKQWNTTVERVQEALTAFLDGSSAQACLRMAGLAKPKQPEVRLRCKQDPTSVASRIIELLKPEDAQLLAEEIITQLAAA